MYYYSLNTRDTKYSQMLKEIGTKHNILNDRGDNILQDPISLYVKDDKYFITINVRDSVSLLYEIQFKNILDLIEDSSKEMCFWDNITRIYSEKLN